MKQSIRLGRVAGIPVGMHWTVAVIAALVTGMLAVSVLPSVIAHQPAGLYWAAAAAGSVLFAAAVAAHEIAHAIVARRRGVTVRSVTLWMLGGITELEGDPPTAAADLQIATAGPATSLAAGIVFGGAAVLAHQASAAAGEASRAGGQPVVFSAEETAMVRAVLATCSRMLTWARDHGSPQERHDRAVPGGVADRGRGGLRSLLVHGPLRHARQPRRWAHLRGVGAAGRDGGGRLPDAGWLRGDRQHLPPPGRAGQGRGHGRPPVRRQAGVRDRRGLGRERAHDAGPAVWHRG